jgi:hypothetical protein
LASSSTPNNAIASKAKLKAKSTKAQQPYIDNDNNQDSFIYDRETEIKEIDARLKSLQLFMKNNMP